jgi:hypothetical protein
LSALGFSTERQQFEYSALPGRFGAPIIGGVGALLSIIVVWRAIGGDRHTDALAITAIAIEIVLLIVLGGSRGTMLPFLRTNATNLEARRGASPTVWLVAHIDSKSQLVSTAVRTLGVMLLLVAMCGLMIGGSSPATWLARIIIASAVLGGGILCLCVVGASSDGAADNASGVAAVLEAASLIASHVSLGVLITDAEELALAGARAWVRGRPPAIAINCDTVDDHGRTVVMWYGRWSRSLGLRAAAIAKSADARAIAMRPLPGVLTDSDAFRQARWTTVTLSRGSLRTLNRIHTARDNLHSLRGDGIAGAAHVLATLVEELT